MTPQRLKQIGMEIYGNKRGWRLNLQKELNIPTTSLNSWLTGKYPIKPSFEKVILEIYEKWKSKTLYTKLITKLNSTIREIAIYYPNDVSYISGIAKGLEMLNLNQLEEIEQLIEEEDLKIIIDKLKK